MALPEDTHRFYDSMHGRPSGPRVESAKVESANDVRDKKRKAKQDEQDKQAAKKPKVVQENRAIWVTNLPRHTDKDDLDEVFSRYGIIDQGADGQKRIKMYADEEGHFNGNALIVYFKRDSIYNAIKLLDGYPLRMDEPNKGNITVEEADPSHKKNHDSEEIVAKLSRKDKKASERIRAELNRKLADWSDDEGETFKPKRNKWAKVCIIKHAFTLEELEEDEEAYLDIKDEMREEAEKIGDVTNVTLFDKEPEGIMTIRFREFDAAEACCDSWNGKSFGFKRLVVTLAEERPKFQKTKREDENEEDEWKLFKIAQD